jgi:Tfp pilus assembly protein PilF
LVKRYPQTQRPATALAAGLLLACVTLCWPQGLVYQNPETLWSDTIQKNDRAAIAYENLGELYIEQGRYDDALPLLKRGKQLAPNWTETYSNLGYLYIATLHIDQAMKEYEEGLSRPPTSDVAESNLLTAYGVGLWQLGRQADASHAFERALALNPENPVAIFNIGLIYYKRADFQKAEFYLNRALTNPASATSSHAALGHLCLAQRRFPEAQQHFMAAALAEPGRPEYLRNLGLALAHQGQLAPALTAMSAAVKLDAMHDPRTLLSQAWVCSLAGQFDLAVQTVQQAIAADQKPGDDLRQEMARSLVAYQRHEHYEPADLDGAAGMVTKASIRR